MARLPDHDALITTYEHLPSLPRAPDALTMLRRITSLVKPIMRARSWRVGTLTEFYPQHEQNLLGLNINRGQRICLRLRFPSDQSLFKPLEEVVDTMLHELAHNVFGPHDASFHKLWNELRDEYMELKMKGYSGEGFLGAGQKLGGRGTVPMTEMRRQARAEAERRRGVQTLAAGSGQKLGGKPVLRGLDMRAVIADAVERRSRITKGCGSGTQEGDRAAEQAGKDSYKTHGFKTQRDEDEANQKAIEEALWELIQQEEDKKQGLEPEVWVARGVGKGPAATAAPAASSSTSPKSTSSKLSKPTSKPPSSSSSSSSKKPTPASSSSSTRSNTPTSTTTTSTSTTSKPKSKLPFAPNFKDRDYNVLRPRISSAQTSRLVGEEERRQRERERINGHVDLTGSSPSASPPAPMRSYPSISTTSHTRSSVTSDSEPKPKREPKPRETYASPPGPPPSSKLPQPPSQVQTPLHFNSTWTCPTCTLVNPTAYLSCGACGLERPMTSAPPSSAAPTARGVPSAGYGRQAGPKTVNDFDIRDYDLSGMDLDPPPSNLNSRNHQAPYQPPYQAPYQAPYQPPYQPPYQAPHQAPHQTPYQALAPSQSKSKKPAAPLGWTCSRCGTFMENHWWTCSLCGGMKESS